MWSSAAAPRCAGQPARTPCIDQHRQRIQSSLMDFPTPPHNHSSHKGLQPQKNLQLTAEHKGLPARWKRSPPVSGHRRLLTVADLQAPHDARRRRSQRHLAALLRVDARWTAERAQLLVAGDLPDLLLPRSCWRAVCAVLRLLGSVGPGSRLTGAQRSAAPCLLAAVRAARERPVIRCVRWSEASTSHVQQLAGLVAALSPRP